MPIPVLMPALSPTMTDGTLARWLKQAGDPVAAGDVIAEIETDKATMEVEAVDEGTLGKILVEEGSEGIAVNTPIALILEEGESEDDLDKFEVAKPDAEEPSAEAAGETPAEADKEASAEKAKEPEKENEKKTERAAAAPSKSSPRPDANGDDRGGARGETAQTARRDATGGRIFASPLARRLAAQKDIDLAQVEGSGPHGRIVKIDIENFRPGAARPAAPGAEVSGEAPFDLVPHSTMRKVIAARLTESKQTVPHFYLTLDLEIDRLLEARKQINEALAEQEIKVSVNDFVIMAAARALVDVPAANASWTDEGLRRFSRADVSVAVAIEGGLITPVVRGADTKTLSQISTEMKALAEKARAGKLQPAEYQGGTFSVSNLGMYGIRDFAAVINPPQGCILAVGAGEQRPVVRDGALAVATVMTCTLSVDHRAVDGAVGAEFLVAFKKKIEQPLAMLA